MNAQPIAHGSAISLGNILPGSQFFGVPDDQSLLVQSCCSRWNECELNDLFVAIVDSDADGHDYAHEAVKRGATAIVTERLLSVDTPQCIVSDSREALGKICHALAGQPSQKATTIGVSGSDGKTVTSHLLRGVFQAANNPTGLLSSIESDLGNSQVQPTMGQLRPPMLAQQLSQMVLGGASHAIVEIPSIGLAQRAFSGVELDAAVLTNIREDHLGFHGSSQNYLRANTRLLKYLKPTGFAIINADDPTSHRLLNRLDCPTLTIAIKQPGEVTGKVIERNAGEQTFLISAGNESAVVRSSIVGTQHIYNCLSAAAVGLACGIDLATITQGLESVSQIPGRMERVDCGQAFGVWIDSARSPRQLSTAINSIHQVIDGRVWCVCSTNEHQTREERRLMGRIVEKTVHRPVITKSMVDQSVDFEPAHQVLDGFSHPSRAQIVPNRIRAIEWALAKCQPGDALLITGRGERPIATVGDKKWQISDRDVCQAWLYDQGDSAGRNDEPPIFNINDFR